MPQLVQLLLTSSGKIFAIFLGLYFLKHLSFPYRLILCQVIIITFCEIFGYLTSFNTKGNAWVFNCFYFLPEIWLTGLAGYWLGKETIVKKITPWLLILGTVVWAIDLYIHGLDVFANWTLIYVSIVLTLIYLNVLINSSLFEKDMLVNPAFWLALSAIFFFSCTIPYFALYKLLSEQSPKLLHQLFYINNVLNFIRYPLVAFSFYLYGRQQIEASKVRSHVR